MFLKQYNQLQLCCFLFSEHKSKYHLTEDYHYCQLRSMNYLKFHFYKPEHLSCQKSPIPFCPEHQILLLTNIMTVSEDAGQTPFVTVHKNMFLSIESLVTGVFA